MNVAGMNRPPLRWKILPGAWLRLGKTLPAHKLSAGIVSIFFLCSNHLCKHLSESARPQFFSRMERSVHSLITGANTWTVDTMQRPPDSRPRLRLSSWSHTISPTSECCHQQLWSFKRQSPRPDFGQPRADGKSAGCGGCGQWVFDGAIGAGRSLYPRWQLAPHVRRTVGYEPRERSARGAGAGDFAERRGRNQLRRYDLSERHGGGHLEVGGVSPGNESDGGGQRYLQRAGRFGGGCGGINSKTRNARRFECEPDRGSGAVDYGAA